MGKKRFFEEEGRLVWRGNGEVLVLEPWGRNSLRVRSHYALLPEPPEPSEVQIEAGEQKAFISNGKLRAELDYGEWFHNCRIHFYNHTGKLLLEEAYHYGGLKKFARGFTPLPGGDHRLEVNFEAPADEKLFGMGQY